jgi:tetratricopeptide (TPR) repeat protein
MGRIRLAFAMLLMLALGCSSRGKDAKEAFDRGTAALDRKDYDAAIAEFTKVIRLDPASYAAYHNRANANAQKQEYAKAIADYSEAILLHPRSFDSYMGRGASRAKMNEYGEAIADYIEAVRLNPKSAPANTSLAWALATCPKDDLRDGKRAVRHATSACETNAWKNANDLENLAAAYAECGNFDLAIRWQRSALDAGATGLQNKENSLQRLKLYQERKPYREE